MTSDTMVLDLEELRNLTLNDRALMGEIRAALLEDAGRHAALIEAASRERQPVLAAKFARSASRACSNLGANAAAEAFRAAERHSSLR